MPAAQTAATSTATFTACALIRTRTEKFDGVYVYDPGATMARLDTTQAHTRVTETGRIEFLPMGEWVLVCASDQNSGGYWTPMTREDARALYKAVVAGTHMHYRGAWAVAEAKTKIVGSKEMPARRETYSYGETAYMYTEVDFPAMTCPIIETTYRGKTERRAAQPFRYTTPPTPGDRYSHNRTAIQWSDAA
jgi:hypothetical protein